MITTGKMLRTLALGGTLALTAGCATMHGPGVAIGVSPGPGLQVQSSACTLGGIPTAHSGVQGLSSTAGINGMRNRISVLFATYALGARSSPLQPSAAWKRVVAGDC